MQWWPWTLQRPVLDNVNWQYPIGDLLQRGSIEHHALIVIGSKHMNLNGCNHASRAHQASPGFKAVAPSLEQAEQLLLDSFGNTTDGHSIGWMVLQGYTGFLAQMKQFYAIHEPYKMNRVPRLMNKYIHNLGALVEQLQIKYPTA